MNPVEHMQGCFSKCMLKIIEKKKSQQPITKYWRECIVLLITHSPSSMEHLKIKPLSIKSLSSPELFK